MLNIFSLGMCTQGVRDALCRNERPPHRGCSLRPSAEPGSWYKLEDSRKDLPKRAAITSCENQDSVVKGMGATAGLCGSVPSSSVMSNSS